MNESDVVLNTVIRILSGACGWSEPVLGGAAVLAHRLNHRQSNTVRIEVSADEDPGVLGLVGKLRSRESVAWRALEEAGLQHAQWASEDRLMLCFAELRIEVVPQRRYKGRTVEQIEIGPMTHWALSNADIAIAALEATELPSILDSEPQRSELTTDLSVLGHHDTKAMVRAANTLDEARFQWLVERLRDETVPDTDALARASLLRARWIDLVDNGATSTLFRIDARAPHLVREHEVSNDDRVWDTLGALGVYEADRFAPQLRQQRWIDAMIEREGLARTGPQAHATAQHHCALARQACADTVRTPGVPPGLPARCHALDTGMWIRTTAAQQIRDRFIDLAG